MYVLFVYSGSCFDLSRSKKWIASIQHQKRFWLVVGALTRWSLGDFSFSDSRSKTACRGFEPFCPCHWKSLETAGFQGFFFVFLRTAHGLLCRISMRKNGADFPSGGIRWQPFRLLHHQCSIKILAPAVFQPELLCFLRYKFCPPEQLLGWAFRLIFQSLR